MNKKRRKNTLFFGQKSTYFPLKQPPENEIHAPNANGRQQYFTEKPSTLYKTLPGETHKRHFLAIQGALTFIS
jgi:hypothetical protein